MKIFISIIILLAVNAFSIDYEEQDTFFLGLEKELIKEYRTCTGDPTVITIDSLFRWKKIINLRTEMPDYKSIRQEFITHTGILIDFLPCQVLDWYRNRLMYGKSREDSLRHTLLIKADETVDSIRIFNELKNNPISKFDFEMIPFGLSKKVFQIIFNREFSFSLIDMKNHFLAEHFYLKERPFFIKFFFNSNDRYYKYVIESYSFTGDSLDLAVRPQAIYLRETAERKIGPPDHLFRIGYFDIKSGTMSPYARWEKETHTVTIGIGLDKIRYYTKKTVESKNLNQ